MNKKTLTDRVAKLTVKMTWESDNAVTVKWFNVGSKKEITELSEFDRKNHGPLFARIEKFCEDNGLFLWSY